MCIRDSCKPQAGGIHVHSRPHRAPGRTNGGLARAGSTATGAVGQPPGPRPDAEAPRELHRYQLQLRGLHCGVPALRYAANL